MSVLIIIALGVLLQRLSDKLKVPSLLLFLVCGIIIGPSYLNILSPQFLSYSKELRHIALVIILLRAGLGLSYESLKTVGRPALFMSFIPGVLEGMAIAVMATLFLGISFYEGGMLGFIIAAVSPAVVVPMMIKLQDKKLGTDKGIPSLILAGASLDDVVAITIFTVFSGLYLGNSSNLLISLLLIPLRIIIGAALGYGAGVLFGKFKYSNTIIVLLTALVFSKFELLAVMVLGFGIRFINKPLSDTINTHLSKVWYIAQMFLFMLVGASFNPQNAMNSGLIGLVIIFIGLLFRTLGVYISLLKTDLNASERLYCAIAYIPKATVQAAMGGVPLALGVASGDMILSISVLSILVCTPIGALLMDKSAPKLLNQS